MLSNRWARLSAAARFCSPSKLSRRCSARSSSPPWRAPAAAVRCTTSARVRRWPTPAPGRPSSPRSGNTIGSSTRNPRSVDRSTCSSTSAATLTAWPSPTSAGSPSPTAWSASPTATPPLPTRARHCPCPPPSSCAAFRCTSSRKASCASGTTASPPTVVAKRSWHAAGSCSAPPLTPAHRYAAAGGRRHHYRDPDRRHSALSPVRGTPAHRRAPAAAALRQLMTQRASPLLPLFPATTVGYVTQPSARCMRVCRARTAVSPRAAPGGHHILATPRPPGLASPPCSLPSARSLGYNPHREQGHVHSGSDLATSGLSRVHRCGSYGMLLRPQSLHLADRPLLQSLILQRVRRA